MPTDRPLPTPLRVVLASQSPRRRDLLTLIGIKHQVLPADIDETVGEDEAPQGHCERLAREKAAKIAATELDAIVIGSDTIVVLDNEILGKPGNAVDAAQMLRRLSGRSHTVHTAVAVAYNGRMASGVETVQVTFRDLSETQIADYVATGEPMDKAGSYGVQGFGATIVTRIDGDFFAVMGLALGLLISLFRALGVEYVFGSGVRLIDSN